MRLELLDLLAQGSRSVDELAQASDQSTANASQHLQALHAAGLVTRERDGTRVRYALAGDETLRVWLALRKASAARLAEVERAAREYLGDEVEAIDRDELVRRMARGDVVLVDVRPEEEYAAGHIEGARSIPLDELERRLSELPVVGHAREALDRGVGDAGELGLRVTEVLRPCAAGGEDEVPLLVAGDLGVGLADLLPKDVYVDLGIGGTHAMTAL